MFVTGSGSGYEGAAAVCGASSIVLMMNGLDKNQKMAGTK